MTKKLNENGEPIEKLTNKAEAVRRALGTLGEDASPLEVQGFIKNHFDVDMTTKVISVYKSKMAKRKAIAAARKTPSERPAVPVILAGADTISMRDLRTLKELKDRHGLSRLRELLELVTR